MSQPVDDGGLRIVCVRPFGSFEAFEQRILQIALNLSAPLQYVTLGGLNQADAELGWLGFLSPALPTVVVVRARRVVAKCIGDLPYRELAELVSTAARMDAPWSAEDSASDGAAGGTSPMRQEGKRHRNPEARVGSEARVDTQARGVHA
jgi:hypothetical protein